MTKLKAFEVRRALILKYVDLVLSKEKKVKTKAFKYKC